LSAWYGVAVYHFLLRVTECTILSLQDQSVQVKDAEAIAI